MADPVRDLNNFLQGHPSGNLTPQFSWDAKQEGPGHQVIHLVTAKFRGVEIGCGRATAMGPAKKEAAIIALQRLRATRL